MKKSLILVLFLSMFLVLVGCGNKTNTQDSSLSLEWQNGEEIVMDNSEMDTEEFESTMEKLYKKGGKMTCTMTTKEDGVEMKWTMYIDGKKMMYDMVWVVWWVDMSMKTLVKDGYSYTRRDGSNEWWKFLEYDDLENEDDEYYEDEYDTPIKFVCKKWISDKKIFDLPSNIKFSEMPDFDF